ncbi:hypothetical protein U9M48_014099 [Paspalum notatum var. saurae]|uniref:WRKY domain-containing protein n=1 Tax=Paspalum notatum var. saurae TaxID=547442 RepID=A0AAQ3T0X0_PASNO
MASVVHGGGGNGGGGGGLVVTELSHIRELVRQLEVHLGGSPDLCKHLAAQISSLTERSIGLVTAGAGRKRSAADAGLASPLSSAAATPTSDVTADGPFFKSTKKRKGLEARRHQVRVSSAAGGDNPAAVDDGHSWRKYGQKEILGAKHPRGYYRCTHRHSQGCPATKQVQRSDDDPALFDVIYHGDHTCVDNKARAGRPAGDAAAAPPPEPEHNPEAHTILQSLTAGLTVKTEGLPASGLAERRSPFSTSENWGVSPATSDSNNNHAANYLPFEDAEWRGQAEFQEVVSALVAASAPPPPPAMDGLDELIASFLA